MKTKIFYFTGTGNSLKVAKDLADELKDTELIPISKIIKNVPVRVTANRIGIIFPVYMWGMPIIVQDFVNKLILQESPYIFAVATYGGFPGGTLFQLNKLLKQKGEKLSVGFNIHMPGNYIVLYSAFSKKRQQRLFRKEKARIKEIGDIIREGRTKTIESSFFLINLFFSAIFYKISSPKIPQMDKGFWVTEKCNSCGICEKLCPVNNIKTDRMYPQWLHHCEQCLACLQWCPQEAIEFGKKTPRRKRYRHPDININEMIL